MDIQTIIGIYGNKDFSVKWDNDTQLFIQIPKNKNIVGQSNIYDFNGNLVCADIGKTLIASNVKTLNNNMFKEKMTYHYSSLLNGLTLRAYWNNGTWNYATRNCININLNTRNTNKTYDGEPEIRKIADIFKNDFKIKNGDKRNKKYTYFYSFYSPKMISHVIYGKEPIIKKLGYVNMESKKRKYMSYTGKGNTWDFIKNKLEDEECGIIVVRKKTNVLLYSQKFMDKKNMLCNSNNIYYCLLDIILKKRINEFVKYYKGETWETRLYDMKADFDSFIQTIHTEYVQKYIKGLKTNYQLSCMILHNQYITKKRNIQLNDVRRIIMNLDTPIVAYMMVISIKI